MSLAVPHPVETNGPASREAASDNALLMRDVRFRYPSTGFGLHVPHYALGPGERGFLRGPSGSGKTTFLGLATGLLAAGEGEVAIGGMTMPDRPSARDALRADAIGVIHQQFNLLPYLDTLSNVLLPLAFGRDVAEEAMETAASLLERLGVPVSLHRAPARRLSVGQQQRVAIARALMGTPKLVVADEPTSALDTDARDAFLDVLFGAVEATGAALLMVSHDPAVGERFPHANDLREIATITTETGA